MDLIENSAENTLIENIIKYLIWGGFGIAFISLVIFIFGVPGISGIPDQEKEVFSAFKLKIALQIPLGILMGILGVGLKHKKNWAWLSKCR